MLFLTLEWLQYMSVSLNVHVLNKKRIPSDKYCSYKGETLALMT